MLTDFKNSFTVRLSEKFARRYRCYTSHHTYSVSLHYLVKTIAKIAQF